MLGDAAPLPAYVKMVIEMKIETVRRQKRCENYPGAADLPLATTDEDGNGPHGHLQGTTIS